jgi:rare lipoprotein A
MFLNRSAGRKFLVTIAAAVSFAALYEVTVLDPPHAAPTPVAGQADPKSTPAPAIKLRFTATAYCKGTTTASGVNVRSGIAAADPDLLPVGSVVRVEGLGEQYNGVYTIMDTGPKVHGRHLDIYIWNCNEALQLGRRNMQVSVLRLGWNPRNSAPKLVERLFRQREADLPPPPPWPPVAEQTEAAAASPAPVPGQAGQ